MKKIFILSIILMTLASCNTSKVDNKIKDSSESKSVEKLEVTTSIIPLASITNYIGWDMVEATSLVPAGVSPHGFDLSPSQLVAIEKSDLVVLLWLDHIDWFLDKAVEDKENKITVKDGITLIEWWEDEHDEHEWHEDEDWHEDEHEEEHSDHEEDEHDEHEKDEDHGLDPHLWQSAENAYLISKNILDELVKLSPQNKEYFEANFEEFNKELSAVKSDFLENSKDKELSNFIVFHDAYNYLFKELGINLDYKHVFKSNLLSEPTTAEMKELIDDVEKEWIKVGFREPQADSGNLNKLASEYKLDIYVLDPLGEDESKNWFIANYKVNLENVMTVYE